MVTWKEMKPVLQAILRWWWVIVLAVGLAAGTAYYLSRFETRYYTARTALMVGNTISTALPDANQIGLSSALARAYGEVAKREPILQPVVDDLHLPISWQYVSDEMLQTNVIPAANLLEVYVTDANPDRAAAIANMIGEQLIAYSPAAPERQQAEQQAINQQITDSQTQIDQLNAKMTQLTAQREKATSAADLTEINQQLDELERTLAKEKDTYRSLLNYKNSASINSLSFFEKALPPSQPLPSKRIVAIGVAGMAGLLLSLAAVYVLNRVDQRWRAGRDVRERFEMEDLGRIPAGPPLIVANGAFAHQRERAIRDTHTNILLAATEGQVRTLLVSSPTPSADRTTFSIDLAHMFARSGQRVLLVDADLNQPTLTRLLLPDAPPVDGDGQTPQDIWAHLKLTAIPNVALLPSGLDGPSAATMVPSSRWPELVKQLQNTADIIIFDGPSALSSADAALLAPHLDGSILVVSPKTDGREEVERSKNRLIHSKHAKLFGAVTITPTKQPTTWDGLHKQLPGSDILALPAAQAQPEVVNDAPEADIYEPVIITPPPEAADVIDGVAEYAFDEGDVVLDEAEVGAEAVPPSTSHTTTRNGRNRRPGRAR